MQIAAQPAFNQRGLALHAAAGKITFAGKMHISAGANASTKPAGDFVIAQVDVRATRRTNCRRRSARNLLFAFTLETLDERTGLSLPKIFEPPKNRERSLLSWDFFRRSQLQARLRRKRRKRTAALATDRTLRRRVFHLLEAAMRAFRTDFCRRRIGHWNLCRKPFLYARTPNAALIGSLDRTTSGRGADFAETAPLVTSDFPMKVAPSSITRRAAFRSPCNTHLDFSSHRSPTVILPCTLP